MTAEKRLLAPLLQRLAGLAFGVLRESNTAGNSVCSCFTACESALVAAAVHVTAPLLLACAAARFTKPHTGNAGCERRSKLPTVLLTLCVLFDGIAAALPLLSHVMPGMITLTGQVAAVSGAASWSAACTLLLVLFSAEHSLDSKRPVLLWAVADTFAGALSIADAACGGIGSTGILWRSAGAILILSSVFCRMLLLLLLLVPWLGAVRTAAEPEGELDAAEDAFSLLAEEPDFGASAVAWGESRPLPALGTSLEDSGLLAQVLMTWPSRMLSAARVRSLFHGDISEAPAETHPAMALETFFLLWARRSREGKHGDGNPHSSLRRSGWILWKMNAVSWSMALALRLVAVVLRLAAILLIRKLLMLDAYSSAEAEDTVPHSTMGPDAWKAVCSISGAIAFLLLSAILGVQGHLFLFVEETKLRNLLWAAFYRTCVVQQAHSPGLCVRRFAAAADIDSVSKGLGAGVAVLEGGVELVVASITLFLLVQLWGIAAAGALVAVTVARVALTMVGWLRPSKWLKVHACHAQRLAASDELLNGILSLKYLGWEHAMAQRVLVLRRRELRALWVLLKLDCIERGLGFGGGLLACALLAAGLSAKLLDPSGSMPQSAPSPVNFLSGLAVVMLMWGTARGLPASAWVLLRGWHALGRLDALLQPQHLSSRIPILPSGEQSAQRGVTGGGEYGAEDAQNRQERPLLVHLDNVTVAWQAQPAVTLARTGLGERADGKAEDSNIRMWRVLQQVKLLVRAGDRVAVVGGPGSGKSSLLMAILGEASVLPPDSVLSHATLSTSFACRPIFVVEARPWVDEELPIEVNVVGWQQTDVRMLSQILDLCGLKHRGNSPVLASRSVGELPSKRMLASTSSNVTWPDELRERVGLARAIYAAALACSSPSRGSRCVVLLDEPLASVRPPTKRANQLQRVLRSSLLANAGIIMACRDSAMLQHGITKVILLRACRAVAVAPPAPSEPDLRTSMFATARPAQGAATGAQQGLDSRVPTIWTVQSNVEDAGNEQEQAGQDDSYLLINEAEDQDRTSGTDSGTDSTTSHTTQLSPQRAAGRPLRSSEGPDITSGAGRSCQGDWATCMMWDHRPHGAGGVCSCRWGHKALGELEPGAQAGYLEQSPAVKDHAHVGRVLLELLHGYKPDPHKSTDEGDQVVATSAPSCLVFLYFLFAWACGCAPYALLLIWASDGSHSPSPTSAQSLSTILGGPDAGPLASCPPWTPCSSNCSARVAIEWKSLTEQLAPGQRGSLIWVYFAALASAAFIALVAGVSSLATSTAWPSLSQLGVLGRSAGAWQWADAWPRINASGGFVGEGAQGDDLVSLLLLRATAADCGALLRSGMLEKIKCALSALHVEGQVDGVASGLPGCDTAAARHLLLRVVRHASCVLVTLSCMLLVWPALALPIFLVVLVVFRLEVQVSSARIHLSRLWQAQACRRLDRLWLALRNGVEMRASCGAREKEEEAFHQALCLEAAPAMTCMGAHLMLALRVDVLGISVTCLPALLTALAHQADGASEAASQQLPGDGLFVGKWLLVGAGLVQGLWCWAHSRALLHEWRCLAQVTHSPLASELD